MTGYKSKQKAAQDKLAHMTFEERCRLSEQCLPEAPYREMLIALHDEMLKSLAQPEQKPVAWVCMNYKKHDIDFDQPEIDAIPIGTMLYTHPQRTWVGLTEDEAQQTFAKHNCTISTHLAGILARAIEAKLKEKNS